MTIARRPTHVNILGITYQIFYFIKPSDVDNRGHESLFGQIDFWNRAIRIYDSGDRQDEDVWQVIWHEIIHGIAEMLHLESLQGEDNHEDLDLLALALTDVLFRNGFIHFDCVQVTTTGANNADH